MNDRLVGVRLPYAAAPPTVRAWAEATLGAPVVDVQPRTGGMSPAVAASLRAANGRTAFVKAVGSEVNPDTPTHFRHEIDVLTALPPAPYRAALLSTFDDGDWVGIALEDVDGRHPDWSSAVDRAAVLEVVRRQNRELTPPAPGLPKESNRGGLVKYLNTIDDATSADIARLPGWAVDQLPRLRALGQQCLDHHRDESFCHWDIRHDNILIRHEDGQPFLLDWGMSRRGQRWADAMVFALEWVDADDFDEILTGVGVTAEEDLDITGLLAALGCWAMIYAALPAPPGLPHLPAFRGQLGAACLAGVRRRLGD